MIEERDAYGRRRSGRNIATGPGSRGGRYLVDEEWRRQWHREYHAQHPEYRERDAERRVALRAEYRRLRDEGMPTFVGTLRLMVKNEAEMTSLYSFARRTAVSKTTLWRFINEEADTAADTIDALVAYFQLHIIYREVLRLRAIARARAHTELPSRRKEVRPTGRRPFPGRWVRRDMTRRFQTWHRVHNVLDDGILTVCIRTMRSVVEDRYLEFTNTRPESDLCVRCDKPSMTYHARWKRAQKQGRQRARRKARLRAAMMPPDPAVEKGDPSGNALIHILDRVHP